MVARIAELVALYVALPALLTLGRLRFHSFPVIPVLWLAMAPIAVWLVRRRGYTPLAVLGIGKAAVTERRLALTLARVLPAMLAMVALRHRIHPD